MPAAEQDARQARSSFEDRLDDASQKLLDLTFRNKLLKYKATKTKHLDVDPSNPIEVFQWLVEGGKSVTFEPQPRGDAPAGEDEETAGLPDWWNKVPPPLEERTRIKALTVPHEAETLERRLRLIAKEADTVLEEQGYNALFLALGFLEWKDAENSNETLRAPLVLVPVKLQRKNVNAKFHALWDEEDPFHNLSLWEKLRE